MIITEISPQKKKGRYNLFIDDEFYSGLDAEAIIKYGLKVGNDITSERIKSIVLDSEERSAFEKIITLISRQPYSRFEIKTKLEKYEYKKEALDKAIEKAESYGYIDDIKFAKMVVESKKIRSKREIEAILYKKGIKNSVIKEATEIISREEENLVALEVSKKYMKNKEKTKKNFSSLYSYLLRKGYSIESINYCLSFFKFELIED